jgi:hypothetical protein
MSVQAQLGSSPMPYKRVWYKSLAFKEAMWGYIFTVPIFLVFFVGLIGLPILFTLYLTFF